MNTEKITSNILRKYNIKANKGFGQNFLIDDDILSGIVENAEINENDIVVEIGPGLGNLTEYLLNKAKKVIAFEIDNRMINILNDRFKDYDNFELVNKDILTVNLDNYIYDLISHYKNFNGKVKVVANLPYYITTPIIFSLFEKATTISEIVVMVQKEVADRIVANPCSKDYGILSVMSELYSNREIVLNVPKTSFNPQPNVNSAVVKLVKTDKYSSVDIESLKRLVKSAFSQRRKKLLNSLVNTRYLDLSKEELKKGLDTLNMKDTVRAEEISLEDYITLSEYYKKETK